MYALRAIAKYSQKSLLFLIASVLALSSFSTIVNADNLPSNHTVTRDGHVVTIDWEDIENATDYSVAVMVDGQETETLYTDNLSTYVDDDTVPNRSYSYLVHAVVPVDPPADPPADTPVEESSDEASNIGLKPAESIEPGPDQTEETQATPLNEDQPTTEEVYLFQTTPVIYGLSSLNATARLSSYNSVTLNFSKIYGLDNYEVYRSTKKTSGYKRIAVTESSSYVDKNLALYTTYYYKVRGVQDVAGKKFYTNWSPTLTKRTVLGKITLKVTKKTHRSAIISWNKVEGATSYKVYRSTNKTKNYKRVKTVQSLSYSDSTLKTGAAYYYKVVPYRSTIKGPTSNVVSVKAALGKTAITKYSFKLGKVTLAWNKVSGASGYKVYRATSPTGKYSLIKTTKSNLFTDTRLANNKGYYYKVRAYRVVDGKRVDGPISETAKVLTPRKAGQYRMPNAGYYVLETSGYGYYSVCASTRCNWQYDVNDNFQNKAYVYVPKGYYLTFDTTDKNARITSASYYYNTPKTSFTKAGHYLVGFDLKPGVYKLSGSDYYYYSVCYSVYCDWGNNYDRNDIVFGGTRYVTLAAGDFLTISGSARGSRQ